MLYFNRIDVIEGVDVNKASESKEWDNCHYWYFLYNGFEFQPNVCNRCYDLLKLVSAIFYQFFIFSPNDSPSKTMKNVLYFILKALFILEIFKFL